MLTRVSIHKDTSSTDSLSGLKTDMAIVKVAMLSITFQNWSRLLYAVRVDLSNSVPHDRRCPKRTAPRLGVRGEPHQIAII